MEIAAVDLSRILDLYSQGLYLQAYHQAQALAPPKEWTGTAPRLLAGRLTRQLGAPKLSRWLFLKAYRGQPTHPEAIYYHARYFLEKHDLFAAWRFLRREREAIADAAPELRADLYSLHAFICARLRDFEQAEVWLDRAMGLAPERPWLHVERAACLEFAERNEEALAAAREAMRLRAMFRPAVQAAGHLLHVLNRDEEAVHLLTEASRVLECGAVLTQLADLHEDLGRPGEARRCYDRFEELSPLLENDVHQWLSARRSDLAYELNDLDAARQHAAEAGEGFHKTVAERLARAGSDAQRVVLERVERLPRPHPPNIPAALAVLRRAWRPDEPLPADDTFRLDAPAEYLERRWAEQGGWAVREFTADGPTLFALLDARVPMALGIVEATFAQLQAVAGYDRRKGILLVRDPAERHLGEMMLEPLLERFRASGPRALIMLPPGEGERLAGIDLPDAELYDALFRIHRAMEAYDRDAAGLELSALVEQHPDHRLTLHAQFIVARYDAHNAEQLAAVDRMLERFPDDPTLLLARAGCLRELDRREERLSLLRRLSSQANADLIFAQQYAQELIPDSRQHGTAERLLRRVIQNRPYVAAAYFFLANLLWDQQRQDEALELYRFAACLDDQSDGLSRTYFRSARAANRTDEARRFLDDRFRRFGDKSSQPARILFNALSDLDQMDEAFAVVDRALARRPADGELLLFAAEMHAAYGKMKAASSLLSAAKEKTRPAAWLRAAANLAGLQGDLQAALKYWREVADAERLAVDAHRAIALRLAETEGRASAMAYLEQLTDIRPRHFGLLQLRIEWLRNEGPAAVVPVVRQLIASHPADAWARRELALHLAELKCFDEARTELESAARLEPPSPSYHCVSGRVFSLAGRNQDARAAYRAALGLSVDNELAISELLSLCPDREQRREELEFVEQELARQPHFGDGILAFHGHAAHTLEPHEVHAALQQLLDRRQDLWQSWSAMIQQLVSMERFPEADALAEQALERFPMLPRLWLDKADVCLAKQDFEGQVEALRQALRISPGWGPAVRELSEALDRDGQLEEGCGLLQQAVARAPLDPANRGQFAEKLWKLGQSSAALAQLREALRLDPGYDWAWRMLGDWAERMEQPEQVADFARELTKQRSGDVRVWLALVRVLNNPAHAEEVLAALNRVLTLNPRNAEARDLKAERLSELSRFEEAAAACAAAPGESEAPLILQGRAAWVHARRGDLQAAIAAMERLVEKEPDYYWGWQQLATWYNEAGQTEEYHRAAEQLVRMRPDSPVALAHLGEAKLMSGDREGGKRDLRAAQQIAPDYPFPGMLLFDEYLADDELDAAGATLAILQEHVGDDFVVTRQVQLATRHGDKSTALDAFRNLCESPIEATWPISSALAALRSAGLSDAADEILKESIQSRLFNPYAALLWLDSPAAEDVPADERLDMLERVLNRYPRHLPAHDRKAELLARVGKFDEAVAACRPAVFGDNPPHMLAGRAAWVEYQRGRCEAAFAQMRAIVQEVPDYFWGWQQLANWYDDGERYEEFLESADQMVRLAPRDPTAFGYRGEARLKVGDRPGAKDDFQMAFDMDPDYAFAGLQLLDAQIEDDELDEAGETLAALRSHGNDDGHLRLRALRLATRRQEQSEAMELLETYATDEDAPPYLFQQAIEAMEKAGWKAAVDATLDTAVDDEHAVALVGRLWMERHAEYDDDACERRLDELLQRGDIGDEALVARLEVLARSKDVKRLFAFIEKYRQDLRASTENWGKTGWAFTHNEAFGRAAEWMSDWEDHDDAQSWMLINLAIALRSLERDDEARQVSIYALENSEEDFTILFHSVWLALDDALAGRTTDAAKRAADIGRDRGKLDPYFRVVFAMAEALLKVQQNGRGVFAESRDQLEKLARENADLEPDPALYHAWKKCVTRLARDAFSVKAWVWARRSAKAPPLPPLPPVVE
jgi:tetratricopeptide (TPR) repeat protein